MKIFILVLILSQGNMRFGGEFKDKEACIKQGEKLLKFKEYFRLPLGGGIIGQDTEDALSIQSYYCIESVKTTSEVKT